MASEVETAQLELPQGIRWWRALVGALLLELLLAAVSVPFVAMGRDDLLSSAVVPATVVAGILAGWWAARRAASAILNGAMVGVMAIALYVALGAVAVLFVPERADFDAALSPIYLATHALKVVCGAVGGWLVARGRA